MSPLNILEQHLVLQLLSPKACAQYASGYVSKHELASAVAKIREISHAYIKHSVGSQLSSPIESVQHAEAYALYYTIINAAKILHINPLLSFASRDISILDLGCGPGTATLALLASLDHALTITCVESSAAMRSVAQRLLSRWNGRGAVRALSMFSTLANAPLEQYNLVVAANVLAEVSESDSRSLLETLIQRVAPQGYLLLLEPGQQIHTRRLMFLRDHLARTAPDLVIQFPCFRMDDCPMLAASNTDWCHGTIEWKQPKLNAQIDEMLGFNKHRIKYSAFLFRQGGSLRSGARVITPPVKSRLGVETTLCGESLYGIARIRKGHRSEKNRALEKASVYDRLLLSAPTIGDIPDTLEVTRAPC